MIVGLEVILLGFANKPKIKISYAASLGGTSPDYQWFDTYGRYLADLKYISVREKEIEEKLSSNFYSGSGGFRVKIEGC